MAFKVVLFACLLAYVNAGYLGPAPAAVAYAAPHPGPIAVHAPSITSQDSNILRSFGNLGQVATQTKTINTPYSSVSKSDVRVSNPGVYGVAPAPVAYAAPAPVAYAAPAPVFHHGIPPPPPAVAYAAPAVHGYAAPHPVAYAAPGPVFHHGIPPPPPAVGVAKIGVAYSAAPAVSHMTYSAPALGLSYAW